MADGKSWMPKVLVGCGCLTLVVIIGLGIAGYFGFFAAKSFVESKSGDFDPGAFVEQAERMAKPSGASDDKATGVSSVSPSSLRKALQKPFTRKDLEQTGAIFRDLRESDAYKQFHSSADAMKEFSKSKDKSAAEQLAGMRDMTKGMTAFKDIQVEYDRLIKAAGGYEQHFGSLARIGGVAAAAKQTAKDHKLADPASDKVAKLIAGDVADVKAEFEKTEAEAEKLKAAGKNDEARMMMMTLLKPAAIAMARMPAKSFETWNSLSVEQRKQALDPHHGMSKEIPALLFLAATPEALVVGSEIDAWK